jgi:hypothetical protein
MLDLQRGVGPVAPTLKTALQVHLPKPDGGWRPLTMLEEGFKAIEGPVTRRLNSQPFFSNSNLAFRPGAPAAGEVLHLDVLLGEDARARTICLFAVFLLIMKSFSTPFSFPPLMPSTIVEGSLTRLVGCTSMLSMMCRFAFPQGWGRLTRLLLPVVALRVQCPLPRCLALPRILCLDSASIVKPPIALLLGEALLALVTRMMSSIMVLDLSISLLFWQNSAQAVLQLV